MKLLSPKKLAAFSIALEAIMANKLRSVLTALGIIFGVAAVIAMLAIGNGAQQEILDQMKLVGVNNIQIEPIVKQVEEEVELQPGSGGGKQKFTPGLTLLDMSSITDVFSSVGHVSPEIEINTFLIKNGLRRSAKVIGVSPSYFDIYNFSLSEGRMFNQHQLKYGEPVCIIGKGIASRFFTGQNPIGKQLKCGQNWLKVVGVLEERRVNTANLEKLGIRDANMDVYVPLQTLLVRYEDRARITGQQLLKAANENNDNDGPPPAPQNYHQLDRLVVQVAQTEQLEPTANALQRMLERRHNQVVDFEITVPELLLKQQQRTKDIFNYVLGAIAGISLIVGGIGIMNIMLASVLERIKEIGLRISLGAQRSDIVWQFLFEAVLISLSGGLIGVVLGSSIAIFISKVADIPTIISFSSIALSFGVAAAIGLIFGIAPARRAASQNPIESLRYE